MIVDKLQITATDGWDLEERTKIEKVRRDESWYKCIERVVEELCPNGFEEFTVRICREEITENQGIWPDKGD